MYEGTDVENFCLMLARMYSKHTHTGAHSHTRTLVQKKTAEETLWRMRCGKWCRKHRKKKKLKSLNIVTW
jgi:hypothetical protein